MKWSSFKFLVVTGALQISALFAGNADRFFFESSGLRATSGDITNSLIFVEATVKQACTDGSGNICIRWSLVLDESSHESLYSSRIMEAASLWSNQSDIPIRMSYTGTLLDNPTSSGADALGNAIMGGNFIVSFKPPAEIVFNSNEASRTIHYVLPDLSAKTGEIKWVAIYFNPSLAPERDYDLRSVLLFEMGRAIGLAPSAVTNSVMYPVRISSGPRTALTSDDILWAASLYGGSTYSKKTGKISGVVLSGKDGSPWIGAHIQALSIDKIDSFSQSLDRKIFTAGTFSQDAGVFSFPALPPGNYILLVEPDTSMPPPLSTLSNYLQKFSTAEIFENEFYDGADRESNQEPAYAFSSQITYYAATLPVTAGKDNAGVSIITNVADPNIARIAAKGATSEILSKSIAPEQKGLAQENNASPLDSSDPGGCEVRAEKSGGLGLSLFGIFSVLCLLLQVRRGLKVRSSHSEFRKRERYYR